jgi:hypothetical protein
MARAPSAVQCALPSSRSAAHPLPPGNPARRFALQPSPEAAADRWPARGTGRGGASVEA